MPTAVIAHLTADPQMVRRMNFCNANAREVSTFLLLFHTFLAHPFLPQKTHSYLPQNWSLRKRTKNACFMQRKGKNSLKHKDDDPLRKVMRTWKIPKFTSSSKKHKFVENIQKVKDLVCSEKSGELTWRVV
jgi:hypothetical protein